MDDLISRQAAIEAISYSEIAFYPGDNEGDCLRRDGDIKQAIMALPSAEPEPLTDAEQRIFLKAISREKEVCKKTDEDYSGELNLEGVCNEIERKVKGAVWGT